MHLHFSSLVEVFKVTEMREQLKYAESRDPKVATGGIQTRSYRKWTAKVELQVAEERLRHRPIMRSIEKGKVGLGVFPVPKLTMPKAKKDTNSSKMKSSLA